MRFKVGDKARIKEDLEIARYYGKYSFVELMNKLKGQIITITTVGENFYYVKEDLIKFRWTDEMLEPVKEYTYEDLCNSPVRNKDNI